jgi:nicotinamidase/pyrazinamidase
MFEGATDDGQSVEDILASHGVTEVDVVGLATDHCVRASALDARKAGVEVRVLLDLVAAVSAETREAALVEMSAAGVTYAD